MAENERGYWLDPETGEVTPVPEAAHGFVIEFEAGARTHGAGTLLTDGVPAGDVRYFGQEGPFFDLPSKIRPATKEEAEGGDRE